jgi:hypothetical protein
VCHEDTLKFDAGSKYLNSVVICVVFPVSTQAMPPPSWTRKTPTPTTRLAPSPKPISQPTQIRAAPVLTFVPPALNEYQKHQIEKVFRYLRHQQKTSRGLRKLMQSWAMNVRVCPAVLVFQKVMKLKQVILKA